MGEGSAVDLDLWDVVEEVPSFAQDKFYLNGNRPMIDQ